MKTNNKYIGLPFFLLTLLYGSNPTDWKLLDSLDGKYYKNDELFTGVSVKKLSTGNLKAEFKNGLPHGTWETSNSKGKVLIKGNYVNGELEGKWEQWYENGNREILPNFYRNEYHGKYFRHL